MRFFVLGLFGFGFGCKSIIKSDDEYINVYTIIHLSGFDLLAKTITRPGNLEALLVKLIEEVKLTNKKLDSIIKQNGNNQIQKHKKIHNEKSIPTSPLAPDVLSLLNLPAHLRKTVIALYKLEKATAEELSTETKRLRAVESAAANQLTRMGYLKKKRQGHKVYFYIEQKPEKNK